MQPIEVDKVKIMVVDDSDIIRYSLKGFFAEYNFEVTTCNDGLEGVQKAVETKPTLIFLDLMMPNLDGVKMLQVIKVMEDLKNTPVIVISGNTNKRNVLAAIEAGADKVISKPLKKEIIIKTIKELLGEEFLRKTRKKQTFSENDNSDIIKQLRKFFVNSFSIKKDGINKAIGTHNTDLLKTIVHEIKGTGGAIGYPQLTKLSCDIEEKLTAKKVDWSSIKLHCEQIFSIVSEIELITEEE